jgi:hypothetical protein
VFNTALEELGRIKDIIIEETAGRIAFAILHKGGFLGLGAYHYPLRWETLRFDDEMDAYIADLDHDVREGGPFYADQAALVAEAAAPTAERVIALCGAPASH